MSIVTVKIEGWLFAAGDVGPRRTAKHLPAAFPGGKQCGIKIRTDSGDLFIPLDDDSLRKFLGPPALAMGTDVKCTLTLSLDETRPVQRSLTVEVKP